MWWSGLALPRGMFEEQSVTSFGQSGPSLFWVSVPKWRGKHGVLDERAKSKRPCRGEEMRKRQASRWEDTRKELKKRLMKNALKFLLWVTSVNSWSPPPRHKTFRIIYLWDFRVWPLMGEERRWEFQAVPSLFSGWAGASQGKLCHIWTVGSAAQKSD